MHSWRKKDIRISSGEVGSLAYEKLKKLSQKQSKSGPKLDAKATIISTGNRNGSSTLPTTARQDVHKFETYTIQTNELTLSLSAASYLFENTVCMFGLTDISIPRTVEAFPKCVEAIYKVLSWKARSCRNTKTFHGLLKKAATQLPKRKFFSPKKLSDPNLVAGVRK
ncbi:18982_t:CDS:2 [Rhizophagus irregularis]|nr:18982_t:CDS:2 [Rhizophagus irregularis]